MFYSSKDQENVTNRVRHQVQTLSGSVQYILSYLTTKKAKKNLRSIDDSKGLAIDIVNLRSKTRQFQIDVSLIHIQSPINQTQSYKV